MPMTASAVGSTTLTAPATRWTPVTGTSTGEVGRRFAHGTETLNGVLHQLMR